MNISTGCEQRIHHDCTANALTNFAWWNDRNGNEIKYWNGDYDLTKEGCACSEDDSCDRNVCNNLSHKNFAQKYFSSNNKKYSWYHWAL